MRTGEWIRAILHVNYRVAVGGEMAICFSANRAQQASYLMPSSYKRSGKFGIREIRYVSYRYAVVGEMDIVCHIIVLNRHCILGRIRIKEGVSSR